MTVKERKIEARRKREAEQYEAYLKAQAKRPRPHRDYSSTFRRLINEPIIVVGE